MRATLASAPRASCLDLASHLMRWCLQGVFLKIRSDERSETALLQKEQPITTPKQPAAA